MLIYDVLHKEKVYRSVANDLRNLGVKHRLKKNAIKSEKLETTRNCSRKVFKVSLSYQPLDVVNLASGAIVHVPAFVCQATTYLENFLCHEGLFRKAGSHARQKDLIARLDAGGSLGEKNHALDVANCLKTFFRDLPEPLIPFAYHDLFVRCLVLRTQAVQALMLACILLPPLHLNTLAFLMGFLKKVSFQESVNRMSVDNLATVIGPNIMPLQEATMSAVQARLDAHLAIIKLLIENAEDIGVLPEHISETITAEVIGSVETELDSSDSVARTRNKKKKHRSGSLTRMFNGLKKMVGKSGSPDEAVQPNNQVALPELDSLGTSPIKAGKKRKVADTGPVSVKKKRVMSDTKHKCTNQYTRPLLASPVCSHPNPAKERSPVHKSKVRKYLTQKVHSEIRVFDKIEKPKKMRLSLERLYSRSKQRVADAEMDQSCKEPYSPYIERRWSSASSSSATKKNHKDETTSGKKKVASPLIRKATTFVDVREDYDRIFMDADVNLSDDCTDQVAINQPLEIGTTKDEHKTTTPRISNCRRSLDAFLLAETAKERTTEHATPKYNKNLRSVYRRLSSNEFTKASIKTCNQTSNVDSCVASKNPVDEEYVRIPKSEYEDIKSRMSAIESRISQEFGSIENHSVDTAETSNSVSNVQSEYEKTLGEASIESTITADNLAKRLSKELKIRRSSEHKIIRSPSARKIGILRRRSQEKVPSKRVNRTASWHITSRTDPRHDEKSADNRLNSVYRSPKVERTKNAEYNQNARISSDSLCSAETNARLNYLQQQLHTLITHTAEHTQGSFSDEDNVGLDNDAFQIATNAFTSAHVRRASSFHGNEFIDNSRYFNNRVKELKKTNSQQNVTMIDQQDYEHDGTERNIEKLKVISWKDAAGYFKSEMRSSAATPVPQTGRASIAKLRTQNAGMVLAKAKLFDDNEARKISNDGNSEKKIHISQENARQTTKTATRLKQEKNLETEISQKKVSLARRKASKSPKNNNTRMRLTSSGNTYSPLIKMEFTIIPSQPDARPNAEKRSNRRVSQNFERVNRETVRNSNVQDEARKNKTDDVGNKRDENDYIENSYVCKSDNIPKRLTCNNSPSVILEESSVNVYNQDANIMCKTPHIKRSLATKTPRSARSLARRQIVDTRRTPLKAVPTLTTPKRQSPRNVLKSRQLSKPIN